MGERTSYEPGTFSWVELSTIDPAGAKAFYGELFGWEFEDTPAGEAGTYTMVRLDGHEVAGLSEQREQERSQGVPPHWNSYVTVADVEEVAGRVRELGGEVLAGPFDVMDAGSMAIVRDPAGAVFSLWEPNEHPGARLVNDVGALCWNELATSDVDGAEEFYSALFGWEIERDDSGYVTCRNGGHLNGGISALTDDEAGAGVLPNWGVCFAVSGADDAVARAGQLGGLVAIPGTDIAIGRFAVIADPQGAVFAVFEGETED